MKREFAAAAAWSTIASWIEQLAAALTFILIARLIGVEDFGVTSMAFAFLFLGEFLVRDTLAEAVVAQPKLEEGRLEATFAILSGFSLIVVLLLAAIASFAAWLYGRPEVALILLAASPTVPMIALAGVSTALLRRNMAYRALAIRTLLGVLAGAATGIVMAWQGFGAWSLVGQRLVEIATNSVYVLIVAGWWPRRLPTRKELGLVRGLGPEVVTLRTLTLVIAQTPTVALGIFGDARAVGLFAFAARLTDIVLTVMVRGFQGVAQSAIAALRRANKPVAGFFIDLTELTALTGFIAFAGLAAIADPLARVLLGDDWSAAAGIIPLLCLAGAANTLILMLEAYLLATDRLRSFLGATGAEAAIGIVLIGLAAPFGAVAVSAAVALRALVALPLRTRATLRHERIAIRSFLAAFEGPLALTAAMLAAVLAWRFVMLGSIGDLTYLALAIAIGAVTAIGLLVAVMPKSVSKLRTFLHFGE